MSVNVTINGLPFLIADQMEIEQVRDPQGFSLELPWLNGGTTHNVNLTGVQEFLDKDFRFGILDDSGKVHWFNSEKAAREVWSFMKETYDGSRGWELVSERKPVRTTIATIHEKIETEY